MVVTITVTVPDTLWATDATEAWTRQQGRCAVFVIVDHRTQKRVPNRVPE
jgi:hypothetical protein